MRKPAALAVQLNGDPVVQPIGDPDAFDAEDCSLYAVADGDDDHMHMIELSLNEVCDCGGNIFHHNRCIGCGATAPWASHLGCGLA